jgi:hypothetical protein
MYELGLPTGGNFGEPKRNQTQIPFSLKHFAGTFFF